MINWQEIIYCDKIYRMSDKFEVDTKAEFEIFLKEKKNAKSWKKVD